MQNPIIFVSEVENGMLVNCCTIGKQQIDCLLLKLLHVWGLLIDFNSLEMCRCL